MDPSLADADLRRLLAQLLRAVSPAMSPAATGDIREPSPDAKEDTGEPAGPFPAVSITEARALTELVAARGIAQGQLAALLGLEKSTVSRLAAGLERKGWIRRGRDENNQRYIRLYLTPAGKAVAGRVWAAWQSRQARILASLSADERAGLAAGLRGLIRGLVAEGLLDISPASPPDQSAGQAPAVPTQHAAPCPTGHLPRVSVMITTGISGMDERNP